MKKGEGEKRELKKGERESEVKFAQLCQTLCNSIDYTVGEGNGTPLRYSCLENPMVGGAWWAAVHGVKKRDRKSVV